MHMNTENKTDRKPELIAAAVLGVAGTVAAPATAAACGATAIPVITTVASWVGLTALSATPIGWFIGCGVAAAALGAGGAALVRSCARTEEHAKQLEKNLP